MTPVQHPQWWAIDAAELARLLGTAANGLSAEEAAARLQVHGENRIRAGHQRPIVAAAISQLRNPLLWLLLAAAIVSLAVGEAHNAWTVIAILVLGSVVSMVQETRAGRALERLRERVALRSRALRDGIEREVLSTSLVPGDAIVLAAGTLVPADAVLIEANDLFISEAALTGEPFAVAKHVQTSPADAPLARRDNMVHSGTNVRSGTGRALVVQTGGATTFGQLAGRLALRPPETEFQHGLRRFGYLLLSIMFVLVVVVFGASALRGHSQIEALLFAIALAVGLAPEMLPAVLATMLSRGARRMATHGVLVRRLEAIENLGNMDVLCTDKTGTLTEGDVKLEAATDAWGQPSPRTARLARWNAVLQAGIPNPLDRAIARDCASDEPIPRKLDEIPFDFSRKRMSVLVEQAGDAAAILVTKGAFEAVLQRCTSVRRGEETDALDAAARAEIHERATAWSRDGARVLALASRPWPTDVPLDHGAEVELTLEGFLTFRDPEKPGVQTAIAHLRELGVAVKMVSGDHHAVARHLAERVGLRTERVVVGGELATLRDEALWHLVERVDVFAEVEPSQKERILLALKKTGHVVGFMGDGINDAPAMHAADIGISVEGATDVAREAADFVLLERDLDIVRDGVIEGRKTFANTMKYVLTTESANLGNMVSMAAAALFLPFLPLLAHQVLLNNFLSDIPSTTLAADRVDPELVDKPRRWDIRFIRRFMIGFGLISAFYDGAMFLLLTMVFGATPEMFRTAWFAESLLTELFVLFVLRTRRRFWASRPHLALVISTLVVAVVAVALPLSPLGRTFDFVALPVGVWLTVFGLATAYVVTVELAKRPLLRFIERTR